jgi:predicted nucleotidyltransferase
MIKEQDKELMIRLLKALYPDVKIYLFGSRARGTHTERSDIDLALDAGRQLSFLEIARARNVLDTLYIPQKIDIVDIYSVPENLRNIIAKEGILWSN